MTNNPQENANALKSEVRRLESELIVLQTHSLPHEEAAKIDSVFQQAAAENPVLKNFGHNLQLEVASAQSLMGARLVRMKLLTLLLESIL